MFELVAQVLPQLVGVIIAPGNMIVVIVLLSAAGGNRKVSLIAVAAFVSAVLLTWGAHFLGASSAGSSGTPGWEAWFDLLAGAVFAALVWPQIQSARHPKAGGPAWLKSLDSLGPVQTIGVGVYIGALNIKSLPLLLHVGMTAGQAKLDGGALLAFAVIIGVFAIVPVVIPLIISVAAGATGKKVLDGLRSFLEAHSGVIMATLFAVLGALFLSKGIEILLK